MLASSRGSNAGPPPPPTAPRAPPPLQHHYPSQMPPFPPPMHVTPPMYGHHLAASQHPNYFRPPLAAPQTPAAPAPAKAPAGGEISEHQRVCRTPANLIITSDTNPFLLGDGNASSHYESGTDRRSRRDRKKCDYGAGTSIEINPVRKLIIFCAEKTIHGNSWRDNYIIQYNPLPSGLVPCSSHISHILASCSIYIYIIKWLCSASTVLVTKPVTRLRHH